jgi:hypothetical protein
MNFNILKPVYQDAEGGEGGTGGGEPTVAELQTQLAASKASVTALEAKQVEILDEAKQAKTARRAAEEAARVTAETEAKNKGDHEQLYKSSESARATLQTEHDALKLSVANGARDNEALKIATQLADGDNIGLLSEHIAKRLKYVDGDLKVLDVNGGVTVSPMSDLANEFKGNTRFTSLLRGNQSTGGGATGSNNSGGAANTITRADFEALNPIAASKFMSGGGSVTD